MNEKRQQILLGILILIGGYFAGEYVWQEKIQKPLIEREEEYASIVEDIGKRTKLFKQTKSLPKRIEAWEKQALPADTETARSLYRNWLLETIRQAKLQNSRVDSGSPSTQSGFRILSVNAQARGTLKQITDVLFALESAALLHKIVTIRLTPMGDTGQFDLAMSIEAVMMPRIKRRALKPANSNRLVSTDRRSYDIIATDNIFGVAVDHRDPMKMTRLTGVTSRNGVLQAWITEQIDDKVHKLTEGASFDTTALSGRILKVDENTILIETGGQQLSMSIGQSFADAIVVSGS